MRSTEFQHADHVAQQLLAAVQGEREQEKAEIFSTVKATEQALISALQNVPGLESVSSDSSDSENTTQDYHANYTVTGQQDFRTSYTATNQVHLQILKLLQKLDNKLDATNNGNNTKPGSVTSSITNGSDSGEARRKRRTDFRFYCSSCGACGHKSKDCRNKGPGHQDKATFENRMNGSKAYCRVAGKL